PFHVTGFQTCALPICPRTRRLARRRSRPAHPGLRRLATPAPVGAAMAAPTKAGTYNGGMRILGEPAYVLRARSWRETSLLVEVRCGERRVGRQRRCRH